MNPKKANKGHRLTILRKTEYKGFDVLIQNYQNLFQFILYKDGNFYQLHNILYPSKGKIHTQDTLVKGTALMLDQAMATVELIINKDNPDKLHEGNEQADEILGVLEEANREDNELIEVTPVKKLPN